MRNLSDNKILYKNTAMLYVMTAAKYILPLVISACLTRKLGPQRYGVITYINSLMAFFLLLFDFGFNYSATKAIAQHRDEPALIQEKINQVMTCKCLLVCIGFVLLLAMTPFVRILREYFFLTFLFYISQALHIFLPDFVYRGLEQMEYVTFRYVIAKLISAALLLLFMQVSDNLLLIPVMYAIGTAVAVVYSVRHMRTSLQLRLSFAPFRQSLPEMRESAIYFASTFASTVLGYFITFIMGIVNMPEVEIGYWGVAIQITQAVQAMYEPITGSLYPYVSRDRSKYRLVLRLTCLLSLFVLLGCVALYFLAPIAVHILAGSEYDNVVPLLRLLIPMVFFSFPAQMFGFPLLGAMGKQRQVTASTIISALFQVVCIFILIGLQHFTLVSIAIVRNLSELILALVRMGFIIWILRAIHKGENHV